MIKSYKTLVPMALLCCAIGSAIPQVSYADNGWRTAFRELRKNNHKAWIEFRKSECKKVNVACKKQFVATHAKAAPELDPNHLGLALLLTAGGALVLTGRRQPLPHQD